MEISQIKENLSNSTSASLAVQEGASVRVVATSFQSFCFDSTEKKCSKVLFDEDVWMRIKFVIPRTFHIRTEIADGNERSERMPLNNDDPREVVASL